MKNVSKPMRNMLIFVSILFGAIFCYKLFGYIMFKRYMASFGNQTVTISAMTAEESAWQPKLTFYGSIRAIEGVNVTTSLAGLVQKIYFTPGTFVKKDDLLVQLNIDADTAQLDSLQANATLAQSVYTRDKAEYKIKAISKAQLDADLANFKSLTAQVDQQKAVIAKKTIRAPFSGHLGISAVNIGQYVNAGDTIVPLQKLDSLYIDFYMPQQDLPKLALNDPVTLTVNTFKNQSFIGKITAINPVIDVNTRNVEVEATINNPQNNLVPGMFGTLNINTGAPEQYITLPQTAISFNPYGDIVYIINKNNIVEQSFVKTGDTRGDQIAILSGLSVGQSVVTSGQMKLKNGAKVTINNTVVPDNNPNPQPIDD